MSSLRPELPATHESSPPAVDAELIQRVFSEHVKLAGEIAHAPTWLVKALDQLHEKIGYVLQAAERVDQRTQAKIALEHLNPSFIVCQPFELNIGLPSDRLAVCLTLQAIDTKHCYALYAYPNPLHQPESSDPDDIPKLFSEKSKELPYMLHVMEEHPGDFSQTTLVNVRPEIALELNRQLGALGVQGPAFYYVSFIQYAKESV